MTSTAKELLLQLLGLAPSGKKVVTNASKEGLVFATSPRAILVLKGNEK